jgi:ribosomal protein L37E
MPTSGTPSRWHWFHHTNRRRNPYRLVPRPVHVSSYVWLFPLILIPIVPASQLIADLFNLKPQPPYTWIRSAFPWFVLIPAYAMLLYQQFHAARILRRASAHHWQLCTHCTYPFHNRRRDFTCTECGTPQNARTSRARWAFARKAFPFITRYIPLPPPRP